jgi:RimJ/RimL family protein N-acetyltransferase
MLQDAPAGPAPLSQDMPAFNTERFTLTPLAPAKLRELAGVLLQDENLAARLPWMQHKTRDGALREAFLLELQCTTGTARAWGIVDRTRRMFIGAVLARTALAGIDLEVLCASRFWNQGVADEAAGPVAQWLEEHAAVEWVVPQ